MSELTELIGIAKNIEKQNDEIIRLLRKIADEKETEKIESVSFDNAFMIVSILSSLNSFCLLPC